LRPIFGHLVSCYVKWCQGSYPLKIETTLRQSTNKLQNVRSKCREIKTRQRGIFFSRYLYWIRTCACHLPIWSNTSSLWKPIGERPSRDAWHPYPTNPILWNTSISCKISMKCKVVCKHSWNLLNQVRPRSNHPKEEWMKMGMAPIHQLLLEKDSHL